MLNDEVRRECAKSETKIREYVDLASNLEDREEIQKLVVELILKLK